MSAPRVVNTVDGAVWTLREATRDGLPLYALAGCERCPAFLMVTYADLTEQGIAGSADVLPVPVGPEPSDRERLRAAFVAALETAHKTQPCSCGSEIWSSCYHPERPGRTHSERRADAVLEVRDAELERLRARVAELEAAPTTVFRAGFQGHDIPLGFYQTRGEARKHCEAFARREMPDWEFAWDEEEDGVQELTLQVDGKFNDWSGYVVTALDIASEYDEEAAE